MSEYSQSGETAEPADLFRPLGELTIPASYNMPVIPGVSLYPDARETELTDNGLVFVGMNTAAYSKIPESRTAQVYTLGLAGCTGIAGVAQIEGGTLAGISHFDAQVDAHQREFGFSPSERFMNRFIDAARKCGAEVVELSIKYAELHRSDPHYGKLGENYDDWHFVDQLESFAQEAEDDVRVTIEPYTDSFMSHTLAVNVGRNSQTHVAFL